MIVATRIPELTASMRLATIRATERQSNAAPHQHLIDALERHGYRVTQPGRAA